MMIFFKEVVMNVNGKFFNIIQETRLGGLSSHTLFVSHSKPDHRAISIGTSLVNTLPDELLTHISSYLKPDTQSIFRLTSRKFNEIILNNAKRAEIDLLRFSNLMGKEELAKKISNFNNLCDILSSAFELKESVINLFNTLSIQEISLLKKSAIDQKLLEYFKSIMELSGIYRQLDEMNSWPNSLDKFQSTDLKIKVLLKYGNGNIDKSLKASNKIPDSYYRSNILVKIIEKLLSHGYVKRGLNITKSMVNISNQSRAFVKIALEYVNEGDIIKALDVKKQINKHDVDSINLYGESLNQACEEVVFSAISLGFAKKGDCVNAALMAVNIPSETKRIKIIDRINEISKMQPDELCHYQPRQDTHLISASYNYGLYLP